MTELLAAVRFVHLGAAVVLAGSFLFLALIAQPAWHGQARVAAVRNFCLQQHRRMLRWSLPLLLVSALAALGLQAAIVGDPGARVGIASAGSAGVDLVVPLLTQTLFGQVWLMRMVLLAVIAVVCWPRASGTANSAPSGGFGLIASACLLASIALSGHAAAGEGWERALQVCADVLHLLAAGAWLGGLVPLSLLLRHCLRNDVAAPEVIRAVTRRYSIMGMVCVGVLLLTGALNAGSLVGGVPQLFGTAYGRLLLLKLALLLPLLAIAARNLWWINPGIAAGPQEQAGEFRSLSRRLARNALLEAGLGVLILLIAGFLGTTPPARHEQPDWPFAFRWDWSVLDTAPKARASIEWGLAWGLLGLVVLQFAFLTRTLRIWSATAGAALFIYGAVTVLIPVTTDAYPTTYRRPAVTYQALSVANGRELYARHCVSCHGAAGYGDGPAAEGLNPRPADLTGRHANAHTAGDLYWWLGNGIRGSAMPAFAASLDEEQRWDLINYVRVLAGARRARKLAAIIEPDAWLVAPDFSYASANGASSTLKEHRGENLVLLVIAGEQNAAARFAQLDAAARRLNEAGVRIIVVPREHSRDKDAAMKRLSLVVEGNSEIRQTYALLAGSFSEEIPGAAPQHAEFLIDKQGYIRARWLPAESEGWAQPDAILVQVDLLQKEVPRAAAPADHVH